MRLINRDTDYAIRALCYIAKSNNGLTSVSELVNNLKISRSFLRKILQILNKKRVLVSYKGKGGGFKLDIPSDKIFLADLLEIFHGPFKLSECFIKKGICPDIKNCKLKKKIDNIERYIKSELSSVSIKSLLNGR